MKIILGLILLSYSVTFSQIRSKNNAVQKKSEVEVRGNNNLIKVVQEDNAISFNLNVPAELASFAKYFFSFPGVDQQIKKLLQYDQQILDIVTKTSKERVLNAKEFVAELEKYIKENEKLKSEIESYKMTTTDLDFAKVLEAANSKLEKYDNEGYQKIIEDYKLNAIKKHEQLSADLANANYFQSLNNFSNGKFDSALQQINTALGFDRTNRTFLKLKGDIQFVLFQMSESIETNIGLLQTEENDTLRSVLLNNIGAAFRDLGDYENAMKYCFTALNLQRNYPNTFPLLLGTTYDNIGSIYIQLDDYDKALRYFDTAILIKASSLGEFNVETAVSYNNKGSAYIRKEKFDSAAIYCNHALDIIQKNAHTKFNLSLADCYDNIGEINLGVRNYAEGFEDLRSSVEIKDFFYGQDNYHSAFTYSLFAFGFMEMQEFDSSIFYFNKVLNIVTPVFGENHQRITNLNFNLGLVYLMHGDSSKGIQHLEKSKLGGYRIVTSLYIDGDRMMQKKRFSDAIAFLAPALQIINTIDTLKSKDLRAQICTYLAIATCIHGNKPKALELFEQALGYCELVESTSNYKKYVLEMYRKCEAK